MASTTIKKGQTRQLKIEKVIFGGRGLAKVDGYTVFVGQVAPGDVVEARIYRKKKSYAEARVVELVSPSHFRVVAPCPYSGFCGGCTWQFLQYEKQAEFKTDQVLESLEHIGGLRGVQVHSALKAQKTFEYRNKMEFSFSDRRWLLPSELSDEDIDRDFALGLHVPGTFHKVLNVDVCLLQSRQGNDILADVKTHTEESGIPPYGLKSHEGFWRFLVLRHSTTYDTWMVNIVTSEGPTSWVQPLADLLLAKYNNITSIVHNVNTRRASIAVGEHETLLAGEPFIKDKIGDFEFKISASSFFQTNSLGAATLYEVVKDYGGFTGRETVLDLYSGTGTIPVYLSHLAARIVGVEIGESAVRDARENCRRNSVDNCTFLCEDISKGLHQILERPDVVIADPPRSGMHPNVVKALRKMAPKRMVYVSCNPTSLARDLGMLAEDYHVLEVQPVDLFPHTYHIECVAKLVRKPGP
jgi:23S rRNA (uracil1939-C5)-methyltransferase